MNDTEAQEFVDRWLEGWNTHDIEKVLEHFTEDVIFTSPLATQLLDGSDGVIRGKAALREYWSEGLRRISDLQFEIVGIYLGLNSLVINYRNHRGGLVNEVLIFEGPLVASGYACYLIGRT